MRFLGYSCRMERDWLNSERMETVEKRSETVALAVFSTAGGIKELKTPDERVDQGILGLLHQMANQCLSWKSKESFRCHYDCMRTICILYTLINTVNGYIHIT